MTRALVFSLVAALTVGGGAVTAERQSAEELNKIRAYVEALVLRESEVAGATMKGFARGVLSDAAVREFHRWDTTNVLWKRERGAGAAPHLAEGVMWDCASRLQGVVTQPIWSAEPAGWDDEKREKARPGLAVKAFERALKEDSTLVEAQFRRARIRAATDAKALETLEKLAAGEAGLVIPYLAAISRAEIAAKHGEPAIAIQWYERAIALHPRSVAATIALSVLRPTAGINLDQLDPSDPYYRYPCRVLTAAVDAELTRRMRTQQ